MTKDLFALLDTCAGRFLGVDLLEGVLRSLANEGLAILSGYEQRGHGRPSIFTQVTQCQSGYNTHARVGIAQDLGKRRDRRFGRGPHLPDFDDRVPPSRWKLVFELADPVAKRPTFQEWVAGEFAHQYPRWIEPRNEKAETQDSPTHSHGH